MPEMIETTEELTAALRAVVAARAELDRLQGFADAAFRRYFEAGQNGAAWQRAENRTNRHSAELESLEIEACRLVDQLPGTWDLDKALRELG